MGGYTKTNHSDRITTLVDKLNTVSEDVGNLSDLNTLGDSDLVGVVNELHDSIDGHTTRLATIDTRLDSLDTVIGVDVALTTDAQTVIGGINEHQTEIGNMILTGLSATTVSGALRELRTELGDVTSLTTTAQTSTVAAINEINAELYNSPDGSGANFNTLAGSVEGAINELHDSLGTLPSRMDSIDTFIDVGIALGTTAQTVVAAINEINTELHGVTDGAGSDLNTLADTFQGAINELHDSLGTIPARMTTAETDIGNTETDVTTLQGRADSLDTFSGITVAFIDEISATAITGAINETYEFAQSIDSGSTVINSRVGSLASLDTNLKVSAVAAINELHDSIDVYINHGDAALNSLTVDSSLVLPVGTTAERPLDKLQGEIRYNTTTASFEGYSGTDWGSLGGVIDVDQDTYITAEASSDEDILKFYTANNIALTLTNALATVAGNMTVQGDLTVSGTTTAVNTETLEIHDNIIELNSNVTGTPSENAGIQIERGTSANVTLQWNETLDRWQAGDSGGILGPASNIVREEDLTSGNGGISITGSTISHTDTSSQASVNNSGRSYIQDISLDSFGHITSITSDEDTYTYTLPGAGTSTRGGVKTGYTEAGKNYPVELDNEQMYVNVPWTDNDTVYSLPAASSSTRGGVKIGYVEAGQNYPVEVSSEKMYVNVPWTDTWQANSSSAVGYVASGSGQNSKVWKTNSSGVPAWRDDENSGGTVTSVAITASTGLSGGGTVTSSGTISLSLDLTELSTDTSDYVATQDHIVYLNNGVQKKKAFGTFNIRNASGTVVAQLLKAD